MSVYPQATLAQLNCGIQLEAILSDTSASGSILSMQALNLRLDTQVLNCPLLYAEFLVRSSMVRLNRQPSFIRSVCLNDVYL